MPKILTLALSLFVSLFIPHNNAALINPQSSSIAPPPPTLIPTPTQVPTVSLGLVGDLGLGRHITSIARAKNDFSWSFQGIGPWLTQNDLTLANLESPIVTNCPKGETGTFTFCGDQRFLPYLKQYKFVFSLANNHIFNYSESGFTETKFFLTNSEIKYVYSHRPDTEFTSTEINGIKLGFLGTDFITNPKYDPSNLISLVKKYRPSVDWLIVSLHWGNEYLAQPEAWRVQLAHDLVYAGADIIHGQHPHVWQGIEDYHGKKIYYSFGNFIFDQSWSYETSHSNVARLVLSKDKIISQQIFPIEIKSNSQPWLFGNPF
jgi:poly-gamma-glutamate synthesis protein (capsule biosynthesis protein)